VLEHIDISVIFSLLSLFPFPSHLLQLIYCLALEVQNSKGSGSGFGSGNKLVEHLIKQCNHSTAVL
jgi:hypothetical protein